MQTVEILERLVGFPTLSRQPNRDLIAYAREILTAAGARCWLDAHTDGTRANLFASLGPEGPGGVILSGHTDVVPVEGQLWSSDPFCLTERDGRLYGRGTADMKGFVAAALAAACRARDLSAPLHLALSYDEEIGCVGIRSLIAALAKAPERPALCLVGEPTSMAVATGHKGKRVFRAVCHGRAGHSALAPRAMNALHLAADLVRALRDEQVRIAAEGLRDAEYDIPYSTLHAGILRAGAQINIVPDSAELDFEIRHLPGEDAEELVARLKAAAERIVEATEDADARIEIEEVNAYPGLDTAVGSEAVGFVKSLTGANGSIKVAFGTEGGLFARDLDVPVVICGPGSMSQGHKPDEFVSLEQLAACDAMLDALLARLRQGL